MASKWSLNERNARKLDEAASAAVKDALDKMDALKAAEEGGSVERAEQVSGMTEEELFSFAEYAVKKYYNTYTRGDQTFAFSSA